MFDKIKQRLFRDAEGEFEQGGEINTHTQSRNNIITTVALTLLTLAMVGIYWVTKKPTSTPSIQPPQEFGNIIEADFTEKDNQSALSAQQQTLADMKTAMTTLEKTLASLQDRTQSQIEKAQKETARWVEQKVREETQDKERALQAQIDQLETQRQSRPETQATVASHGQPQYDTVNQSETFGAQKLPPRPTPLSKDNPNIKEMSYSPSQSPAFRTEAFHSFTFNWDSDEDTYRRTIENYVPTGTFVTAVVTGGADANAGVLGQGDTTPMVFQTVNDGVLPNGKPSQLNDCTITASAYGEISSSRGIVRTNRMSCILDNGEILDVPVKATAFNFGRNGIRGTTILKNSEIVQMAGVAGILTGIGQTGAALSQTTSTSALGSTQTLSAENAGLNLLGNATSSIGSKLSDYYIGLAEMYHPIVEINPGAVVNIVFLEGFPLDPLKAEEYEQNLNATDAQTSSSNQILDIISNGVAASTSNPLSNELSAQGITAPPRPFGQAQ